MYRNYYQHTFKSLRTVSTQLPITCKSYESIQNTTEVHVNHDERHQNIMPYCMQSITKNIKNIIKLDVNHDEQY